MLKKKQHKTIGQFFFIRALSIRIRSSDDVTFKKKPNAFWLVGALHERLTLCLDLRHINYSFEILFCFTPLPKPQFTTGNSNVVSSIDYPCIRLYPSCTEILFLISLSFFVMKLLVQGSLAFYRFFSLFYDYG